MASVVSSATFIGAVLEQAGYEAQANYLVQFQDFFLEAGAFLYTLAAVGAVVSFTVFGSFRAARYLLLGPALFWFLVGPTHEYDGVIWRLGGGMARGMNNLRGEGISRAHVNETLRGAGLPAGGASIRVAKGFALFAGPINEIVRDLIDEMLSDEDGQYLHHISRTRALEYAIAAQPVDTTFIEMMEGNMIAGCGEMFRAQVALSSEELRPEAIGRGGVANVAAVRLRIEYYRQQIERLRTLRMVTPNPATRRFMRALWNLPANDPRLERVDCGIMWTLVAEYLEQHAVRMTRNIILMARGDGTDAAAEERGCQFLMEKFGGALEGSCRDRLKRVVAAYLLRNSVRDRRSGSRFIERIVASQESQGGIPAGALVSLVAPPAGYEWGPAISSSSRWAIAGEGAVDTIGRIYRHLIGDPTAPPILYQQAEMALIPIAGAVGDPRAPVRTSQWTPVARSSGIGGPMDASFQEMARYNVKELRQTLFSWSLHIPYWQGVILYLLASAYPFLALVVLVPGRAVSFLNLPLAWLWVKSWDVGIAAVMVFDRVLWNIRPRVALSPAVFGKPLRDMELYEVIAETSKADQNWGLSMHYLVLSMATLSIPAVTGYVTLKSRRAILSSFTEKLIGDAKTAGQMLAGAYSTQMMGDRVRAMREFGAVAGRAMAITTGANTGVEGEGRWKTGMFFGGIAAAGHGAEKGILSGKGGFAGKSPAALRAGAEGVRTFADIVGKQFDFDRANTLAFDSHVGRWGMPRMEMMALAASGDKSGGFEIDDPDANAYKEYIDLFTSKMRVLSDVAANAAVANRKLGVGLLLAPHKGVQEGVEALIDLALDRGKALTGVEAEKAVALLTQVPEQIAGVKWKELVGSGVTTARELVHLTPEAMEKMNTGALDDPRYTFRPIEETSKRPAHRFTFAHLPPPGLPELWDMTSAPVPAVAHTALAEEDVAQVGSAAMNFYSLKLAEQQEELFKRDPRLAEGHTKVVRQAKAVREFMVEHGVVTHEQFTANKQLAGIYEGYVAAANEFYGLRAIPAADRNILTPQQFVAIPKMQEPFRQAPQAGQSTQKYLEGIGPMLLKGVSERSKGWAHLPFSNSEREELLQKAHKEVFPFLTNSVVTESWYRQRLDESLRGVRVGPYGFATPPAEGGAKKAGK